MSDQLNTPGWAAYLLSAGDLYTLSELHPERFTIGLRMWFWTRVLVGGVVALMRRARHA